MKYAGRDGNRLDFVVLADALRALLAQARANTVNIGKDERLAPAAAYQRVENNRLEKRQAQGIRREGHALPWMGGYQVEGRESHSPSPVNPNASLRSILARTWRDIRTAGRRSAFERSRRHVMPFLLSAGGRDR